jgi:folate-binding protein YgfZ
VDPERLTQYGLTLPDVYLAVQRSDINIPGGQVNLQGRRLLLGLPVAPHELNEDHNPLEAGLTDAISFDKGCYVGQEVVARLNAYDKVSRSLVGLALPVDGGLPAPGTAVVVEGSPAGQVTSAAWPPGWPHPVALAYLKNRSARPTVDLPLPGGAVRATVVELPFDTSAS